MRYVIQSGSQYYERRMGISQDFTAFNSQGGTAETWLINYTKQLRTKLPQGQYILSHARRLFILS